VQRETETDRLGIMNSNPSSSTVPNKLTAGDRPTTSGCTHQSSVHRITLWEGRDQHTCTIQNDNQFSFPTNTPSKSIFCCCCFVFVSCNLLLACFSVS